MKQRLTQPSRKLVVMLLATTLAGLPLASEARLGGSSGSRSTAVARPAPAVSGSSSRIGSGGSAGMTRPDVMARARSNAPAAGSVNPGAYPGGAAMPAAPAPAPRSGPGWGTVAGAAAVGAAAGYMLGDHNSPQAPAQAGATTPAAGSTSAASQDVQRSAAQAGAPLEQQKDAGGFGFGGVLGLLLLTGAGFWAFRRYTAAQQSGFARAAAPAASFKADTTPGFGSGGTATDPGIEQIALKTFNELQDANNRSDLPFLRSRLDALMYQQIAADIQQRGGPGHTQVVSMRAELVDITDQGGRRLVSIHYTGMIVEDPNTPPENLDEVWHYVDENRGAWKLAGIEQV